jgi:hypothetical protein
MGESKPVDPENKGKIRLRLSSLYSLQVQVFSFVSASGSREVVFGIWQHNCKLYDLRHVEVKVIQN